MKILILAPKVPFPPKDGGAIATLSLAEGLADAGHEILMLCLNTNKHPFDVSKIHSSLTKKIKFFAVNHNTNIRPLHLLINLLFSKEPYNARRFLSERFNKMLKNLLLKEKPNIVQLEGPYMTHYIPAIKRHSEAKITLRAHNVESEIWKRKTLKTRNPITKLYLGNLSNRIEKLEIRTVDSCDVIVAISERDRSHLLNSATTPSITIPTGLNPHRYPTPKAPEFPSLFFIGALDWMPNQEGINWFLEVVFSKLRDKLPTIQLHIAGRNAPEWLVNNFLSQKKNGIVYHGEVDSAYEFMNKYAIFISPLFTGSGIRIKILEGMMMKRAIIATTIAAEGIPASDQENIFISDDPDDMISIITDLCLNKEKYDKIGEQSRQFVIENFNNLATSKKLSDFYRSNLL